MDTLNPLTLLDNLLADYIGPKGRRAIHSLILLAGLIVTIYLAAGRNWEQAIITLVLSLYAEANRANTPAVDLDPAGEDSVPDDGDTYEEAGGAPLPSAPLVSGEPVVPTQDGGPRVAGDEDTLTDSAASPNTYTPRDAGL